MTDTSQAAYADIAPYASAIRDEILVALSLADATTEELADLTGIDYSALQPRTTELRKAGRIIDSTKRAKNRSGKSAIVWALAA